MKAVVRLTTRIYRNRVYYSITFPKRIAEKLGWMKGDLLLVETTDSEVVIKKLV